VLQVIEDRKIVELCLVINFVGFWPKLLPDKLKAQCQNSGFLQEKQMADLPLDGLVPGGLVLG
jgi:hypothetical protein